MRQDAQAGFFLLEIIHDRLLHNAHGRILNIRNTLYRVTQMRGEV